MTIFRQYVLPFLIVLVFFVALVAVSARIFLPSDMAAPAPIEEVNPQPQKAEAHLPPSLSMLVKGVPDSLALSEQFRMTVN
ncbi:hypothetical protein [Aliterella atlantica]|uniref:hypothetical protein n=1 Tax=Aliterella atlantica TaxID=1827278 RepID=UPI0005D31988|nr:hypothetical protein [Aliterella atlantica]